jgi:hypothetical protein
MRKLACCLGERFSGPYHQHRTTMRDAVEWTVPRKWYNLLKLGDEAAGVEMDVKRCSTRLTIGIHFFGVYFAVAAPFTSCIFLAFPTDALGSLRARNSAAFWSM